MSLKSVPQNPINNIPALVQIMAWRRPGDKPLSEPTMVKLPTHICVIRPPAFKVTHTSRYCRRVQDMEKQRHPYNTLYTWYYVTYVLRYNKLQCCLYNFVQYNKMLYKTLQWLRPNTHHSLKTQWSIVWYHIRYPIPNGYCGELREYLPRKNGPALSETSCFDRICPGKTITRYVLLFMSHTICLLW